MIEVDIDKEVYLECYHHLLEENDIDIEILFGGRDSGKSKFIAQYFTEQAMMLDYFRCLLIKETHESIKDAQWQMIKDNADQWGVDSLFKFVTSPLSIKCANGNTFATRGLDKPGKIRSFSNPSHLWGEEANQYSEDSFITLLTGMRSDYGSVKLFLSLNPEANTADFTEFWLYKMFFANYNYEKIFLGTITTKIKRLVNNILIEEEISITFRITHTTYHDNPYVSPQRIAFHESLQLTNPYWYRVFTEGLWGNQENDSPWAFAFSRKKHVGPTKLNRAEILYTCWDFNRNPMTCTIIQWYGLHIYVLEVIKIPNSGVDAVCMRIQIAYPSCLYIVTGDYSGTAKTSLFEEQITHYSQIKKFLRVNEGQIKVKPNPRLNKNQTLVNTILSYYDVTIDPYKAKPLIFDMENVKKRADGSIVKVDREDPAQQSDALDTFRYFCNYFLADYKPVIPGNS